MTKSISRLLLRTELVLTGSRLKGGGLCLSRVHWFGDAEGLIPGARVSNSFWVSGLPPYKIFLLF